MCGKCSVQFYSFITGRKPAFVCLFCKRLYCGKCVTSSEREAFTMEDGSEQQGFCCVLCMRAREKALFSRQRATELRLQEEEMRRRSEAMARYTLEQQLQAEHALRMQHQAILSERNTQLSYLIDEQERIRRSQAEMDEATQDLVALGFERLEARLALVEAKNNKDDAIALMHSRRAKAAGGKAASRSLPATPLASFTIVRHINERQTVSVVVDPQHPERQVALRCINMPAGLPIDGAFQQRIACLLQLEAELGVDALPNMMRVESVSYAPGCVYVQTPYVQNAARLTDWIDRDQPPVWVLQSFFRDVLQAIQRLHSKGNAGVLAVHTDILAQAGSDPEHPHAILLHSFDAFTERARALPVLPPEVVDCTSDESIDWTEKADMYIFGACLYYAVFKAHPVLLPDDEAVRVKASKGVTEPLCQLLTGLLTRSPARRLTALAALQHSFFTDSLVEEYQDQGLIIQTDKKIKAMEDFIKMCKKTIESSPKNVLTVTRGYIVESTCTQIMQVPGDHLHRGLSVNFAGEPGVDAGGLTMELFHAFFTALFPSGTEEVEGQLFVTSGSGGLNETPTFLPATVNMGSSEDAEMVRQRESLYEGAGRMMAKAIFEGVSVTCPLCPAVFKFFLDLEPSMSDLDSFDSRLCTSLRDLLQIADASDLYLDFSDVGGSPDTIVSNDNREDYVRRMVRQVLVERRRGPLQAMKKGFEALPITSHLALFSGVELMSLIQGKQVIAPDELLAAIEFQSFERASQTPAKVRAFLSSLTNKDIRRFLCFVTASTALPRGKKIVIKRVGGEESSFPVAHTCFLRLDMPDYPHLVEQRLRFCIDRLEEAGFGLA